MKKYIIYPAVFVLLLTGCKREVNNTNTIDYAEAVVDTAAAGVYDAETRCYLYHANGSKIEMKVVYDGNRVSGTLDYALAEKDKNTGTFNGTIINNKLIIDYTFNSEGTKSTRQLAFRMRDENLYEGFGPMTTDGNHFKDVKNIQFTSNMPLEKVDCKK